MTVDRMAGLLLATVWAVCPAATTYAAPQGQYQFRHDFEDASEKACWEGWSDTPGIQADLASPGFGSATCLRFTLPRPGWDTAIVRFEPAIVVNPRTVVQFRMKADRSGGCGLNVRNATDGAEYYIAFTVTETGWIQVRKYLKDAAYKRFGKEGAALDGMLGDQVGSIQIAYRGSELCVDDFEVVDATGDLPELPDDGLAFDGEYTLRDYECLKTVFPFGVISTIAAGNRLNAQLLGQTTAERFEDDLIDLRLHYLNTLSNFCDVTDIAWRLPLMNRYQMYLVETMLSNTNVAALPQDAPQRKVIARHRHDPRLLAWYGRDEPTDYRSYLDSKLALNSLDPAHPVASAFNEMSAAKVLGPFMELIMVDHYSLNVGWEPLKSLQFHSNLIREGKRLCGGGKVWFIAQSFSRRAGKRLTLRMPTPAEIRFEVFNCLSAGVDGLLFFIYNDACGYLDGKFRGEEFDDTLVDPWGNADPAYDELSALARSIVPVMPSLFDAREKPNVAPTVEFDRDSLILGKMVNARGTYLVFVNKNLEQGFAGEANIDVPQGLGLYDLLARKPVFIGEDGTVKLELKPGGAAMLMLASPGNWAATRRDILSRQVLQEYEVLDVRVKLLQAAGLQVAGVRAVLDKLSGKTDGGNALQALAALKTASESLTRIEMQATEYRRTRTRLDRAQATFGSIHRAIRSVIVDVDATDDPAWVELFEQIKALSRRYFDARRCWKRGDSVPADEAQALTTALDGLQARVEAQVRSLRQAK